MELEDQHGVWHRAGTDVVAVAVTITTVLLSKASPAPALLEIGREIRK